ncbi:MAG: TIGR01459 family HAD-type hydrolase [Rhodobacteraceae bacterium]|nr:TIGR01459 family HAD-type hydrolase [Paracoccaceae bacterium]
MTPIIPSLASIADRYDAVFCDLWGCLHNGKTPFPAAVAALQAFRAGGGRVVLLTNAPRPRAGIMAQLDRMGVPRDAWDLIVSSGDATQLALAAGAVGRRIHFIGADKDEPIFTEFPPSLGDAMATLSRVPPDQATGTLCCGLADDQTETPDDYRAQLLLMKQFDLPMLCANPDIVVDQGEKRLWCAGALAAEYEQMGGKAFYFGKPHPPVYDLARRQLADLTGQDDARILCIGDGILTDVKGGVAEGLDTLFVTGGLAAAEFGPDTDNPDAELLNAWIAAQGFVPTWAIGHLR